MKLKIKVFHSILLLSILTALSLGSQFIWADFLHAWSLTWMFIIFVPTETVNDYIKTLTKIF